MFLSAIGFVDDHVCLFVCLLDACTVLTFPIGLFWCKNLENVDASSSMGGLKNDFGCNADLVANATPS